MQLEKKMNNYKLKGDYDKLLNDILSKTEKEKKSKKSNKNDNSNVPYEEQVKQLKFINNANIGDKEKITRKKTIFDSMSNEKLINYIMEVERTNQTLTKEKNKNYQKIHELEQKNVDLNTLMKIVKDRNIDLEEEARNLQKKIDNLSNEVRNNEIFRPSIAMNSQARISRLSKLNATGINAQKFNISKGGGFSNKKKVEKFKLKDMNKDQSQKAALNKFENISMDLYGVKEVENEEEDQENKKTEKNKIELNTNQSGLNYEGKKNANKNIDISNNKGFGINDPKDKNYKLGIGISAQFNSGNKNNNKPNLDSNLASSGMFFDGTTNDINLITFSDDVKLFRGDYNFFTSLEMKAYGCTYMNNAINHLETILSKIAEKTNIRILSVSDGELHDQEETVEKASELYNKYKDKFLVNSQAVRLYTSSSEPDTKGMSSLMQFSNITEPKLIDIDAHKDLNLIAEEISALFKSDGLGCSLYINSKEKIFMENPWSEASDKLKLIFGENIFWMNNIPEKVEISDNENKLIADVKLEICENITIKNYQNILESKIKYFYQKLKVLKVVNTESASKEINKIINYFESFENILNLENIDKEENLKESEKFKISSRAFLLKKLIEKRNISISHKMKEIQNNDKVSQLNAKQLADFLRNLDINKEGKGLARRGFKEGIDFDEVARKEVLEMLNHIKELDDIDDSNHNVSFYSTSTTLDGIKSVCELAKDQSVLENLTAIDIIKLLNIVGNAI